jgi:phosphotransferase system enzyme I (PtsP)
MAGKPLSAMALLGIGFRSVSMAATSIGPVKAMLLGLDVDQLSAELHAALDDSRSLVPIRDLLVQFAQAHNIPL